MMLITKFLVLEKVIRIFIDKVYISVKTPWNFSENKAYLFLEWKLKKKNEMLIFQCWLLTLKNMNAVA